MNASKKQKQSNSDLSSARKNTNYWKTLGRLRVDSSKFKWNKSDKDGKRKKDSVLFWDNELGRAYYSSFVLRGNRYSVGDFAIFSYPKKETKFEIFRIVGAFQAMKSFIGVWQTSNDEIQKRGHPYALVVPFSRLNKSLYRYSDKEKTRLHAPLHNEIALDIRKCRHVDDKYIQMLPIWLGEDHLTIEKISVKLMKHPKKNIKHGSNEYVLLHCICEKYNAHRKKEAHCLTALQGDQRSLLTSSPDQLLQKHIPTYWHSQFNATHVQMKSLRTKQNRNNNISTTITTEIRDCSSDESYVEMNHETLHDDIETRHNYNYKDGIARIVVEHATDDESMSIPSSYPLHQDSLQTYYIIPDKTEIDSISNCDRFSQLHKDMISRNEIVINKYGFDHPSHLQKYICYKAKLKKDLFITNVSKEDVFLFTVVPALSEMGVTIMVQGKPLGMEHQLQQLQSSKNIQEDLKTKLLDLDALIVPHLPPEYQLENIYHQMWKNTFQMSLVIFITQKLILETNILKQLLKIQALRMLNRVVFYNCDAIQVVKICGYLQMTPYINFPCDQCISTIVTLAQNLYHDDKRKPYLFSCYPKSVAFSVERKLNQDQVMTRIIHILQSFTKKVYMEEHPNKTRHPLENNSAENGKKESMDKHLFPKSICYCQNESECKKLQQVFKAKLGIDTETIVNGNLRQKIQATIENFRLGKTRVLCLTEAENDLNRITDITFIFHTSLPMSMKDYTIETQYAGRNGDQAFCILFFEIQGLLQCKDVKSDDFQALFHYGTNGNINICRNKMLGQEKLIFQHKIKNSQYIKYHFCCDNCQLRNQEFKQRRNDDSKDVEITWMMNEFLSIKDQSNALNDVEGFLEKHSLSNYFHQKEITDNESCDSQHSLKMERWREISKYFDNYHSLSTDVRLLLGYFKTHKFDFLVFKIRLEATFKYHEHMVSTKNLTNDEKMRYNDLENKHRQESYNIYLSEIIDQECKYIEQFNTTACGIESPHVKMPLKIEARWLMYFPFVVYFEICRLYNTEDIDLEKFDIKIMDKLCNPNWNCDKYFDAQILLQDLQQRQIKNTLKQDYPIQDSNITFHSQLQNNKPNLILLPPVKQRRCTCLHKKFGSHRFLYLQIKSSQRRHMDKLMLDTFTLHLCCRTYRFLWLDKYSTPQIYIFFAEKGLGISQEMEITVDNVKKWCLDGSITPHMTVNEEYEAMVKKAAEYPEMKMGNTNLQAKDGELFVATLTQKNIVDDAWKNLDSIDDISNPI